MRPSLLQARFGLSVFAAECRHHLCQVAYEPSIGSAVMEMLADRLCSFVEALLLCQYRDGEKMPLGFTDLR
jgi:hypothetical protein